MAAESVLECRGLRRRFGEIVAVDGVGFHIDPGETYGLIAMTGSVALIESRRLGVSRRMLATPTSSATVIAGETLGRVLISCVQALVIIVLEDGGDVLVAGGNSLPGPSAGLP